MHVYVLCACIVNHGHCNCVTMQTHANHEAVNQNIFLASVISTTALICAWNSTIETLLTKIWIYIYIYISYIYIITNKKINMFTPLQIYFISSSTSSSDGVWTEICFFLTINKRECQLMSWWNKFTMDYIYMFSCSLSLYIYIYGSACDFYTCFYTIISRALNPLFRLFCSMI